MWVIMVLEFRPGFRHLGLLLKNRRPLTITSVKDTTGVPSYTYVNGVKGHVESFLCKIL